MHCYVLAHWLSFVRFCLALAQVSSGDRDHAIILVDAF